MAGKSKIEWTDATWNPVAGCDKVSPGCANCYAEVMANRLAGMARDDIANGKDPGKKRHYLDVINERGKWNGVMRMIPETLDQPFRWKKPRMIFVNSMSDLFHEDVPDGFIMDVWRVMAECDWHTFQILTKRPERAAKWLARYNDLTGEDFSDFKNARGPEAVRSAHPSGRGQMFAEMLELWGEPPEGAAYPTFDWMEGMMRWPNFPLDNVWIGTSIENQQTADERIPHLLQIPAKVRFLSCEPLLGPILLEDYHPKHGPPILNRTYLRKSVNPATMEVDHARVDWVIVGGESGPNARPMHPDWARSLRDQCQAAGVAFHFKQHGEHIAYTQVTTPEQREAFSQATIRGEQSYFGACVVQGPSGPVTGTTPGVEPVSYARIGKKAAGRLLDGREWNELPEVQ